MMVHAADCQRATASGGDPLLNCRSREEVELRQSPNIAKLSSSPDVLVEFELRHIFQRVLGRTA
jgi:hypothetical protein